MIQLPKIVFYLASIYVLFAYLFYPLSILFFSVLRKKIKWLKSKKFPSVAFLISVYNEEKVIRKKIENTLSLNYPKTKLKIYIASDASTDKSNDIIQEYAAKEENVFLYLLPNRSGKNGGINYVRKFINEEIIVFSDANSIYNKDSLIHLVEPYNNQTIGCVIGDLTFTNINEFNISEAENTYWKFERIIKKLETRIGRVIIGNGAIISIREKLLQFIPPEIANDLYIPVLVRNLKYNVIFNFNAKAFENSSINPVEEYHRKVRIITRGITALFLTYKNTKLYIWLQLFFRKALRWFVGYALIFIYISNIFLVYDDSVFVITFALQNLFYLMALLYKLNIKFKIGSYAFYYCLINLAGIKGTLNKFFGRQIKTWNIPTSTR
jgi:cellulose synthase/poly-beta-1,6-N-acetylglucosamine synthase-like glycosyltransferase